MRSLFCVAAVALAIGAPGAYAQGKANPALKNPASLKDKAPATFKAKFVTTKVSAFTPEKKEQLVRVITAVSAEAGLRSQGGVDARDAKLIDEGRGLFREGINCANCHAFGKKDPDATGPDLTGYGSREWLIKFISDPGHADFYGERNDRMPAFGRSGMLKTEQIELVADWLRGEWYQGKPE